LANEPTMSSVNVDKPLTNMLQKITPMGFIGPSCVPELRVRDKTGKYYTFTQDELFRSGADPVEPGSRAPRGGFFISTDTYSCVTYKFASPLPDEIRDNADSPLQLPVNKAMFCRDQIMLAREIRCATMLQTAASWTSASPVTGPQWNQVNSKPIDDVEYAISVVLGKTGYRPNTVVMGYDVFKELKLHSTILDRIKYTSANAPTPALMASLWDVDRVLVGTAIKNTSEQGATASYSYVWNDYVWVGYVPPRAGVDLPSPAYQFMWKPVEARTFREEAEDQTVYECRQSVDEEIVTATLGYVIEDTLASGGDP